MSSRLCHAAWCKAVLPNTSCRNQLEYPRLTRANSPALPLRDDSTTIEPSQCRLQRWLAGGGSWSAVQMNRRESFPPLCSLAHTETGGTAVELYIYPMVWFLRPCGVRPRVLARVTMSADRPHQSDKHGSNAHADFSIRATLQRSGRVFGAVTAAKLALALIMAARRGQRCDRTTMRVLRTALTFLLFQFVNGFAVASNF